MEGLLASLGEEIQDADEETFDVFSQSIPSQDLGMVDPKAATLELSIAGRDFEVAQSPGVLQSSRDGGTTGAAVWQASVRFAEWIEWSKNPLFRHDVVSSSSIALELGSGVSGLVPSVLAPRVRRMIATDQSYILKTLRDNITANTKQTSHRKKSSKKFRHQEHDDNTEVFALDWENDDILSVMTANGLSSGIDLVSACDCVYNYALISPFVQTCADICKMRQTESGQDTTPTVVVIAQQLRQPDVFQQWMETFHKNFRVWRVPSDTLSPGLCEGSGYSVHVGILRD